MLLHRDVVEKERLPGFPRKGALTYLIRTPDRGAGHCADADK